MNNFPTTLLLTMVALAVVLAAAWLILRGLAKMGVAQNRNGRLKVLESVPIGSRERVLVIEFDSKEYLIGVTANTITQLDAEKATDKPSISETLEKYPQ